MLDLIYTENTVIKKTDLVFKLSFLLLFTSIYALYKKQYLAGLITFSIFLTSLNYWRNPVDGSWQFYLDISVVQMGLIVGLWKAYGSRYMVYIYSIFVIGELFYLCGIYFKYMNNHIYSTYYHCIVHLCGNCAVWLFVSG